MSHNFRIMVCEFRLTSLMLLPCFVVSRISVSSTYIMADIVNVVNVMAETNVALIGMVAITLSNMMLIETHMGPAASFPCPLPCKGRFGAVRT